MLRAVGRRSAPWPNVTCPRVRADQAGEDPVSPFRRTYAARTHLGPGSTDPRPSTAFDAQTAALIQDHPAPTGVRAGPIQLGEGRLVARPASATVEATVRPPIA